MTKSSRRDVVLGVVSVAVGAGIGWVLGSYPEVSCGPFRYDKSAEWAGVIVSGVAAGATIWAVLASIRTARHAADMAYRIHQEGVDAQSAKDASLRARLATVFRTEIWLAGEQLDFMSKSLKAALSEGSAADVIRILREEIPTKGLTLLREFSSDLHVFPPQTGARLLNALWRWNAFMEGPRLTSVDPESLRSGAGNVIGTIDAVLSDFSGAWSAIEPLIPEFENSRPPSVEWHQHDKRGRV